MREITMDDKMNKGTMMLKESYHKLMEVADFCQDKYSKTDNTAVALEETLQYTTESLASVAYQINILARDFLEVLDSQSEKMKDIESKVNHLDMRVQVHRERVARRAIGQYTTSKPTCHLNDTRQPGVIFPEHVEKPTKYIRKPIDYSVLDRVGHGVRVQAVRKMDPQLMVTTNNAAPRRSSGSDGGSGIYDTSHPPSQGSRSSTLSHQSGAEYARYAVNMHSGGTATLGRMMGNRVASVAQQPPMQLAGQYAPTGQNLVGTVRRGSGSSLQYATPTVPRGTAGGQPQPIQHPQQPPTGIAQPISQHQQQQQYSPHPPAAISQPTAMMAAQQMHYQTVHMDDKRSSQTSHGPPQAPVGAIPCAMTPAVYAQAGIPSPPIMSTPAPPPPPAFEATESTPQLPPPPVMETSTIDLDTIYYQRCLEQRRNSLHQPPPPYHVYQQRRGSQQVPTTNQSYHQGYRQISSSPDSPPPPPPPPEAFNFPPSSTPQPAHPAVVTHHGMTTVDANELPPPPSMQSQQAAAPQMEAPREEALAPELSANYHAKVGDDPLWAPDFYIEKVMTLYEYVRDKDDELTFGENQIIYVVKKNDDGWWEGVMNGLTGLFPGNYVEVID